MRISDWSSDVCSSDLDYVTKPFSPRELVARVNAVLRRVRPALAGAELRYDDLVMDTVGHKVRRDGQVIPLGPTEFRLLRHFLEHPGWVFSRERLLDRSEEHTSELQSLMRISYAVFCLKK